MKKLFVLLFMGMFALTYEASAQTATTAPMDTVAAKELLGKYITKDAPMEAVIVTIQNGKLMGEAVGQGSAELAPTKEVDVYEVVGYDGKIEFIRNENKMVVKMKLIMQGAMIEGIKQ